MKVLGIIPARYGSTRFPGKPLALLSGRPMVQWVYERACQAKMLTEVIVATDDRRIFNVVKEFGGRVVMTRADHPSGSDRIAEVAATSDAEIIVNIQGDEPLIEPAAIDLGVNILLDNPAAQVGTLIRPIRDVADLRNPNVVKVVLAQDNTALYFSRSAIPFCRGAKTEDEWLRQHTYFKHIGLYIFRRDMLLQFVKWPPGVLEKIESLEQLRLLEHGVKIHVAVTEYEGRSVDTEEDLETMMKDDGRGLLNSIE
ncbi:MAG: 3-deoxy-manno-octulosonate cytidylyltransferase [candidate division KSB1 bacterium]|nr:3-deoxy-manno-octulosonate cytidylyltransferase [candidate division KSB1 bacterium]MDZ7301654.1 3-deoxy-manno-octulosonate cytidylyltransferase [candidate division KSB1 bacterium]MDZ7313485.1 3-deoxy-manno-octulosonate cytidylyltransferase [candidate division KSB1 bacterium]